MEDILRKAHSLVTVKKMLQTVQPAVIAAQMRKEEGRM
jgi:hypothetical protein